MLQIRFMVLLLALSSGLGWADGVRTNKPNVEPVKQEAIQEAVISSAVDINQAGADELATLISIGPKKALQIIAYRDLNGRFSSIEDLKNVKGIGDATVEKNRVRMMVAAE